MSHCGTYAEVDLTAQLTTIVDTKDPLLCLSVTNGYFRCPGSLLHVTAYGTPDACTKSATLAPAGMFHFTLPACCMLRPPPLFSFFPLCHTSHVRRVVLVCVLSFRLSVSQSDQNQTCLATHLLVIATMAPNCNFLLVTSKCVCACQTTHST